MRSLTPGWRVALLALAAMFVVCVAVVARLGYLIANGDWPGGMRSSYPTVDHDARLTQIASSAKPMIAALGEYRVALGKFPEDLKALALGAPSKDESERLPDEHQGWSYQVLDNGTGYEIHTQLGWDPLLIYKVSGTVGQWIFEPGDGTAERPVVLEP